MYYSLSETDIVFVDKVPYKPFWFEQHMYFVNIYTGKLFTQTPIYLGENKVADLSQLKNYFQKNEIEIVDGRSAL